MTDPHREILPSPSPHPSTEPNGDAPTRPRRRSRAFGIRRGVWLLALSAAAAAGSCGRETGSGTDGITHWLQCESADDCASDDPCVCGLCLPRCSTDADCRALRADAVCRDASELESEGDCTSVTSGQVCTTTDSTASAAGGAAGTAGSGPSTSTAGSPGAAGAANAGSAGAPTETAGAGASAAAGRGASPSAGGANAGGPSNVGGALPGGAGGGGASGGSAGVPTEPAVADRVIAIPEEQECYAHSARPALVELCPGSCGNGALDSCEIPDVLCPQQGGPCQPLAAEEECDAALLQGLTCEALGFARGALACTESCRFDWAPCAVCGSDPRIEDCARVEGTYLASTQQELALATDGTQAAVAWAEQSNSSALARLRFAVVNDDLSLTLADCFGEELANLAPALSAVPGGFMLAHTDSTTELSYAVRIWLFDREARLLGSPAPTLPGRPAQLVSRPDGGPLLIYSVPIGVAGETTGALMAALLDETGELVWSQRVADLTNLYESVAVYTDDGFLWFGRRSLGEDALVARIEVDGTVTTSTLALPETANYPSLTWDGSEARLFWDELWIPLDKYGVAQGEVRSLLGAEASQPRSTVVPGATVTLLLTGMDEPPLGALSSGSSAGHHEVVRVDADGNAGAPLAVLRNGNQGPSFQHQLVTVGERVLVAARSDDQRLGSSIYLAWLRP